MTVRSLLVAAALLCSAHRAPAQQISGSITGVVKDSQQAAVSNAKITLNSREQGTNRDGVTSADGSFVFTQVQPGTYTLTVEATGFKKFEQTEIKVFANDRVGLGDIILSVGALSETVTVEAQVATVQTASAERVGRADHSSGYGPGRKRTQPLRPDARPAGHRVHGRPRRHPGEREPRQPE